MPTEPEPPTDEPLPPPSDDPLPPPEEPEPEPEEEPEPEGAEPEPEITDEPLPEPEDPREDEPPLREQEEDENDDTVELETEGDVFDCGLGEPGCHVSNWFADFVISGLNPALGWLAEKAFFTPLPTAGMEALHNGILATSNAFYVIFIVVGGLLAMCFQTVQTRYSAADILPRLIFGFIASNFSLWATREMVSASNQIAVAIAAQGIDARTAAENLRDRMDVLLPDALVFTLFLLVVVVVLLVTWILTEAVRICMVIVLVIAAPMLLMFHALPQTNRLAELWWRCMAGLCAIPIAQSIVFIAMVRLFFEGQMTLFGAFKDRPVREDELDDQALVLDGSSETIMLASTVLSSPEAEVRDADWLLNIMLFLVLLYVQIRISTWVMKLVWQPNPGTSPIAALLKNIAWMMAFRKVGNLGSSTLVKNGLDLGFRMPSPPGFTRQGTLKRPVMNSSSISGSSRARGNAPDGRKLQGSHARRVAQGKQGTPPGTVVAGGSREVPGSSGNPVGTADPYAEGPSPRSGQAGVPPQPPSQSVPPRTGQPPHAASPRDGPSDTGAPRRRALEVGGMPGSPKYGQQTLFPRPGPSADSNGPASSPGRRWRQEVLPTPPPTRVPGRRATERLGMPGSNTRPSAGLRHLPEMPALNWNKPPHVKGQRALFPNPKNRWRGKQYGLFDRPDRNTK